MSEESELHLQEWKRKKAKLILIEKVMSYTGFEYQRLGGEIFSDYIFAQREDPYTRDLLQYLEHLTKNNVPQDVSPRIDLLVTHAEFLKELAEVRKELIEEIKKLQPETHKEAPVPNVNS